MLVGLIWLKHCKISMQLELYETNFFFRVVGISTPNYRYISVNTPGEYKGVDNTPSIFENELSGITQRHVYIGKIFVNFI